MSQYHGPNPSQYPGSRPPPQPSHIASSSASYPYAPTPHGAAAPAGGDYVMMAASPGSCFLSSDQMGYVAVQMSPQMRPSHFGGGHQPAYQGAPHSGYGPTASPLHTAAPYAAAAVHDSNDGPRAGTQPVGAMQPGGGAKCPEQPMAAAPAPLMVGAGAGQSSMYVHRPHPHVLQPMQSMPMHAIRAPQVMPPLQPPPRARSLCDRSVPGAPCADPRRGIPHARPARQRRPRATTHSPSGGAPIRARAP